MLGGLPLTGFPADTEAAAQGGAERSGTAGKRFVIGLTGKMCAGKNVAAEILAEHGCATIDADKAAHAALDACREQVFAAFSGEAEKRGLRIRNPDGSVNRPQLGRLLFADKALLAAHEALLYPRINEILRSFAEENGGRHVVINAPLLFKSDAVFLCDLVVVITAPALRRFFRARKRDRMGIVQILRRFSAQRNLLAQNPAKNTDIITVDNRGGREALERKLLSALAEKGIAI